MRWDIVDTQFRRHWTRIEGTGAPHQTSETANEEENRVVRIGSEVNMFIKVEILYYDIITPLDNICTVYFVISIFCISLQSLDAYKRARACVLF